jgi:hypothetical protein
MPFVGLTEFTHAFFWLVAIPTTLASEKDSPAAILASLSTGEQFLETLPRQAVLSLPALMRWRRFDVGSRTLAA